MTILQLYEDNGGGLHWIRQVKNEKRVCHFPLNRCIEGCGMADVVDLLSDNPQGDWHFEELKDSDLEYADRILMVTGGHRKIMALMWYRDFINEDGLKGGRAAKAYILGRH